MTFPSTFFSVFLSKLESNCFNFNTCLKQLSVLKYTKSYESFYFVTTTFHVEIHNAEIETRFVQMNTIEIYNFNSCFKHRFKAGIFGVVLFGKFIFLFRHISKILQSTQNEAYTKNCSLRYHTHYDGTCICKIGWIEYKWSLRATYCAIFSHNLLQSLLHKPNTLHCFRLMYNVLSNDALTCIQRTIVYGLTQQ